MDSVVQELDNILKKYSSKRVVVLGTTCCGKSTYLQSIPYAVDMDEIVFPLLSQEESDYVCQTPWTLEIGETMIRLTKERVKIEPGKPVFGTVLLDADLIVYLDISDKVLKQRCNKRNVNYEDAKNMQKSIEEEIQESEIECVKIKI